MEANGHVEASGGSSMTTSYSVYRFLVIGRGNNKKVEARLGNGERVEVKDLADLPTYSGFFAATVENPVPYEEELYIDFERVFMELRRAKIKLEGEYNCANRLLNIRRAATTVKASKGYIYYNPEDDRDTYGSVVSTRVSGVMFPTIQVHIEEQKTDRHGRTTNNLKLCKQTLYLVKGLTEHVPSRVPEIHIFRAPRAYIDQVLMCDTYNYPKVGYLTMTKETSRGRELMTQIERSTRQICDKCVAKTDVLLFEDCHVDGCSVSGTLGFYGPTARLLSNDVLFSRFETVRTRAVELWPSVYVSIVKATSLMARLYRNSRRDFVSEIIRTSRVRPATFLGVANVSRKVRSYFKEENTCYMLGPGPRGQLEQSEPLDINLSIGQISIEIDGQYVDRVNLRNFSLTQTENGIYHISPSDEPYTGPKDLGEVKLGGVEDRN